MIDDKGRLFGKINLIDLLVLLLAVAAVVLVAVQLLGGGPELAEPTPTGTGTPAPTPTPGSSVIEYTVKVSRMRPEEYDRIKECYDGGDTQFMTNGGREVEGSQVIGLESKPSINVNRGKDDVFRIENDPYYLDVYFTARSTTSNERLNTVNTQEARIGRTFIVKTRNYEVSGLIVACDRVDGGEETGR